jgi:hypothetical protein
VTYTAIGGKRGIVQPAPKLLNLHKKKKGWPEPYIYTVYLVNFLPKIPYIHRIYMVLANPKKETK